MSQNTMADDPKRRVIATFDVIARDYDGMQFVRVCASRQIELAALTPGLRVLDLATGTGLVALVAAEMVGPAGAVIGIDISPAMLEQARQKLSSTGLGNVEFREGDAERLDFPDQQFDVVLCASSLFFVPNMAGALRECLRVLKPGGRVGFTAFGPNFLRPLRDLWAARLKPYGITAPWPPTQRLEDPATCRSLLEEAGFAEIDVRTEQLGYRLATAEERWKEIFAGVEGMPVMKLPAAQREQIRTEHLAELNAAASAEGIWVDVPAHIAFGRKRMAAL